MQRTPCTVYCSVADPERVDADPDPTFQADADPGWIKKGGVVV